MPAHVSPAARRCASLAEPCESQEFRRDAREDRSAMIRLFVGLELPDDIRFALAGLCSGVPGADWEPAENFHLTLRFVGDVSESDGDDIHDALTRVRAPGFAMSLAGVGHFATGDELRTLWAGVEKSPALLQLQRNVESALVRMGLPPETRRFHPHVTLARCAGVPAPRAQAFLAHHALFRAGPFDVGHFTHFTSLRRAEGAIYTAEAEYPLPLPV
jgi:2'-5' RNA ligase